MDNLASRKIASVADAIKAAIADFQHLDNQIRSHQAGNELTPAEYPAFLHAAIPMIRSR